jgi:hypothetical protein
VLFLCPEFGVKIKQQKRHPSNRNAILAKAGISSRKESSSEEKSHPRESGDIIKKRVILRRK